jgi:nucleotide-binding universal stress UspA family protein
MLPLRTIVHPTDFSETSEQAFRLAGSLARDHGARLLLLHVFSPAALAEERGFLGPSEEPYDRVKEAFRRLEASDARLGELDVKCLIEIGNPIQKILHSAAETGCDLIVMGTHGRTGLHHVLMGSVAEQVVRKAPCPVLTVKKPLRHEPPSGEPRLEEEQRYWQTARL